MSIRRERRLRLACEFGSAQVVAAHADENGVIDTSAVRALRVGALTPNLTGANLVAGEAVRTALQEALAVVGTRTKDVITILPDAACRVVLIDFDVLPAKREDADALVRFRLKKSLPFDVDKARVSWQKQEAAGKLNVLAAVTLSSVLEEYEGVVRSAGCSPGVVMPSLLAALGQVEGMAATLVVKVDPLSTSLAIVNQGVVLLVRTLDHAAGRPPEGAQLAEDLYPALMFFQDTYGTKVEKILVGGMSTVEALDAVLTDSTGISVEELTGASRLGVSGSQRAALAAVAGALA